MPPCWESLTPGVSTEEDVRQVLAASPDIPSASVGEDAPYSLRGRRVSRIFWSWDPPEPDRWGLALLFDGTLAGVTFVPVAAPTFASAVEELGPPDHVAFEQVMWERACYVSLEWDDIAISATAYLRNSCPGADAPPTQLAVSPHLRVLTLYYASPDALHPYEVGPVIRPWTGFVEGIHAYTDLLPGGPETWFLPLVALVAAVIIAFTAKRLNPLIAGFVLAAIGACVPTMNLQFSDVVFPTCAAYIANTAVSGACLSLLIVGLRRLVHPARPRAVSNESQVSE